ncbi:TetR family transcriptional regulator [Fodinicola acaciae]|uniref:TetR/AcrR family transcriptional regulator n=1 Tax=Fodinicola acaciae TaxID=2681555 RepID=UPI0013D6CC14|nr:TetR family transcriptional regulator [Fodinicola acaciae]
MAEHSTRRSGRWRSGEQSRQRILAAAREHFRAHGYAGTTVRAVAAEAGVDPAMVFYFFGNKQGLFGAAIDMYAGLPPAIDAMFAAGLDGIGDRLVRTLVENMDQSDKAPLALLNGPGPQPDYVEGLLREYIEREITGRLTALLDAPDAAMRVGMVNVQLLGLAVTRYVIKLEPIASATVNELVERFGAIAQRCLTGTS